MPSLLPSVGLFLSFLLLHSSSLKQLATLNVFRDGDWDDDEDGRRWRVYLILIMSIITCHFYYLPYLMVNELKNRTSNSSSSEATTAVAGKETVGTAAPGRWNPTKEQINMLENLYRHGVRTPTAEQIQEITSRLQTYGHIEGKNVFYWFQNHKARQRQKQKQDHLSYFHQYLHHHHHHHQPAAVFPIPYHPNVVYGQCYIPQSDIGFYPKVLIPTATAIRRRSPRTAKTKISAGAGTLTGGNNPIKPKLVNGKNYNHQETLDLFPLHPTGILQQKEAPASNVNHHALTACTSSSSERMQDQLYFDFFSC